MFVQDEQRQLVFFNVVTNEIIRRTLDDGTGGRGITCTTCAFYSLLLL